MSANDVGELHHVRVPALDAVRGRVDEALLAFLRDRRDELSGMDPAAGTLVDEIVRVVRSGGKRIRPALCSWAYRAAGGIDEGPVVRAGAALELLHTFALIHDDVMDGAQERRGVASTAARYAAAAPSGADSTRYGAAMAILVGDLAAVLAEQLLRTCGADPATVGPVMDRFDRMRVEMAAGQLLDLSDAGPGPSPPRVASLKTGSYTAEGPVLVGAALAGATRAVEAPLRVYAGLLGEAFQLRDDVLDGDAAPEAAARVNDLVRRAVAALAAGGLEQEGRDRLVELATLLRLEGAR